MASNTGTPELKAITTKYNLVVDTLNGKKKIPISLPEDTPSPEGLVRGIECVATKSTPTSIDFDKSWAEPLYNNASLKYIEDLCTNILEMVIVNSVQLKAAKRQLHDTIEDYEFRRARLVLD